MGISGHQAIFSNLSKLLTRIFTIAADKQPYEDVVIMLDYIDYHVMRKLMQYVYEGEPRINKQEGIQLFELQLEVPLSTFEIQETFDLDSEHCMDTLSNEATNDDFYSTDSNDEVSTSVKDEPSLNFDNSRSDQVNVRINPMPIDKQMLDMIAVDNDVKIQTTELNSNRKPEKDQLGSTIEIPVLQRQNTNQTSIVNSEKGLVEMENTNDVLPIFDTDDSSIEERSIGFNTCQKNAVDIISELKKPILNKNKSVRNKKQRQKK